MITVIIKKNRLSGNKEGGLAMNPLLCCRCIWGLLPMILALVLNCAKYKQRSKTAQTQTKRTANPHELCVPCASGVRLVWVCCAFDPNAVRQNGITGGITPNYGLMPNAYRMIFTPNLVLSSARNRLLRKS